MHPWGHILGGPEELGAVGSWRMMVSRVRGGKLSALCVQTPAHRPLHANSCMQALAQTLACKAMHVKNYLQICVQMLAWQPWCANLCMQTSACKSLHCNPWCANLCMQPFACSPCVQTLACQPWCANLRTQPMVCKPLRANPCVQALWLQKGGRPAPCTPCQPHLYFQSPRAV